MDEWVWSIGGMILTGETEVLGEKHYTVCVVDEWMSMELWWNYTDRGNWSAGRKTLYSVGSRWMNEYEALVEWYWQGKLKCWEKNLSLCNFVDHKSDRNWPGIEPGPPWCLRIQSVPRSKHSVSVIKTSQLMLYREIIALCSVIHAEHIYTQCGQNVEFLNVKPGGA